MLYVSFCVCESVYVSVALFLPVCVFVIIISPSSLRGIVFLQLLLLLFLAAIFGM